MSLVITHLLDLGERFKTGIYQPLVTAIGVGTAEKKPLEF